MNHFLLNTLAVCISLLASPALAIQTRTPQNDLRAYFTSATFLGLDWCRESWSGSDAPFISVKRSIDRQITKGKKRDALLPSYRKAAVAIPLDPRAQFAYAYAAWRATETVTDGRMIDPLLSPALEAMGRATSPKSYEYTRLRWILEHTSGQYSGYMPMIGLGKRLMIRAPKDRVVRFYLMEELLRSSVKTDLTVELPRYAQQVEKELNLKAPTYALLGDVYRNLCFVLRDPGYADKSLANYQRYLRTTPSNYFPQYREAIQERIERVRTLKVRFSKDR